MTSFATVLNLRGKVLAISLKMCLGYRLLQDFLGATGTKKVEEHCHRPTTGAFRRQNN